MLFSPIEMVRFYFFCSGFHHQEHVAGLCTFNLFYLMKYVYKFQECSSGQFQCDHLKVGDFGLSKLKVQNTHDVDKMTGETGSCECL